MKQAYYLHFVIMCDYVPIVTHAYCSVLFLYSMLDMRFSKVNIVPLVVFYALIMNYNIPLVHSC